VPLLAMNSRVPPLAVGVTLGADERAQRLMSAPHPADYEEYGHHPSAATSVRASVAGRDKRD
jgi:hypothetical protein